MSGYIKLDYKLISISSIMLIINAMTMNSIVGQVLPFLHVAVVLSYLFIGKLQNAILIHFFFMLTSFGVLEEDVSTLRTGYFATKLYGPITLSYLIAFILFVTTIYRQKYLKVIPNLFTKLSKLFLLFLVSGTIIGLLGLFLSDYFSDAFMVYFVYIVILVVHAYLLSNNYSDDFLKKCFNLVVSLFVASWISTFYNYCAHITYDYSIFEKTIEATITPFSIVLLLALPHIKQKKLIIVLFILYLFVLLSSGASGKFFLNVLIILIFFILRQCMQKKEARFRYIFVLVSIITTLIFSIQFVDQDSMFAYKMNSFISLFNVFSDNIDAIEASPYIRVASMSNIYLENLTNPLYFFCGRGYGGYFQDQLNMFDIVDISVGGFKETYISSGKFPAAHSTFNVVPLLHGFCGFYFLIRLILKYALRGIRESFLNIVAILWLLISFYYNIQLAIFGILVLFAAEYDYKK